MKRIYLGSLLISMAVYGGAKTPQTAVSVMRPSSSRAGVVQPQTQGTVFHPVTVGEMRHPQTQTTVFHPQTNVAVQHPTTAVTVVQPATQVAVQHPTTTVEVFHPQTDVVVFHPQTQEIPGADATEATSGRMGGKSVSSSQVSTSMSNFKPMQAKKFSAAEQAAPTGGGSLNLGNSTNQEEKDNVNKSSLLGMQNNQDMKVDPKKHSLKGLEKKVTDIAKVNEKKK